MFAFLELQFVMHYPNLIQKAIEQGYLTPQQAGECLEAHGRGESLSLESFLIKNGYLKIEQLQKLLATVSGSAAVRETAHPDEATKKMLRLGGLSPGASIGPFTIVRLLGRGGMGAVYLAEQSSPRREVALKMMTKYSAGDIHSQRFLREAQLNAQLDHPNIVKTFMAGVEEDIPYLAMSYIDGMTLDAYFDKVDTALEQKLRIFGAVARALHFAHEAGIVHRDIKPSNIMVAGDGTPVVMDFGIARSIRVRDRRLTRTGEVLGTPQYMSMEQARGERDLDGRADVYSLGAVMYESLTGRPMFAEGNTLELLYQICNSQPKPPCAVNPAIPPAVEAIVLKCISKKRELRYRSALELSEDIARYLDGRTVMAACKRPAAVPGYAKVLSCVGALLASLGCLLFLFGPSEAEKTASPADVDEETRLVQMLQKEPSVALYLKYLVLLEKNGNYQIALGKCDEAIRWAGEREKAQLLLKKADLLLKNRAYHPALILCREIADMLAGEKRDIAVLNWAEAAYGLGRYGELRAILDRIDGGSNLSLPLQQRYFFYRGARKLREFLAAPREHYLEGVKGGNFLGDAELQDAVRDLQYAAAIECPGNLDEQISHYLAYGYTSLSNWPKAGEYLQRASGPRTLLLEEASGIYHYSRDNFEEAAAHFSQCISFLPWEGRYYYFRAMANVKKQEIPMEQLVEDCLKAIELLPANMDPLGILVESLLNASGLEDMRDIVSLLSLSLRRLSDLSEPKLWIPEFEEAARACLADLPELPTPLSENHINVLVDTVFTGPESAYEVARDTLGRSWREEYIVRRLKTRGEKVQGDTRAKERFERTMEVIREQEEEYRKKELNVLLARYMVGRDSGVRFQVRDRIELLEKLLGDDGENLYLRHWAAEMLAGVRTPETVEILKRGCNERDPITASFCAVALANARLPVPPEFSSMNLRKMKRMSFLAYKNPDKFLPKGLRKIKKLPPEALVIVLHYLGPSLPPILTGKYLEDPREKVRCAAAKVLLRARELPALLRPEEIESWGGKNAMRPFLDKRTTDLSELAKASAVLLSKSLSSDCEEVRAYALWWLWQANSGHFDDIRDTLLTEAHLSRLNGALLSDKVPLVRRAAAISLSNLALADLPEASRELLEKSKKSLYQALPAEPDETVRFHIITALMHFGLATEAFQYAMQPGEVFFNRVLPFFEAIELAIEGRKGEIISAVSTPILENRIDPGKDADMRFRYFYLLMLAHVIGEQRDNMLALPLVQSWVFPKIQAGIDSQVEDERVAALHAFTLINDDNLKGLESQIKKFLEKIEEKLQVEQSPRVRRAIYGALAYHLYYLCYDSSCLNSDNERQFFADVRKQDDFLKKGAAYGYYRFMANSYRQSVDDRLFEGVSRWGIDQKYQLHLEALVAGICRGVNDQKLFLLEKGTNAALAPELAQAREFGYMNLAALLEQAEGEMIAGEKSEDAVLLAHLGRRIFKILKPLQKARELDPGNSKYHYEAAVLLEALGEWEKAMAAVEDALRLEPERALYRLAQVRLLFKMGEQERLQRQKSDLLRQASEKLKKMIDQSVGGYCVAELEGKICLALGDWRGAERAFEMQAIFAPYLPEPRIFRAHSRLWSDDVEGARKDLEEAEKLLEKERERVKSSRHVEHVWEFTKIFRAEGYWHFETARLYAHKGQVQKAVDHCRKGVENFSRHYANFPVTPFTQRNMLRYPEFGDLPESFTRQLPLAITGFTRSYRQR